MTVKRRTRAKQTEQSIAWLGQARVYLLERKEFSTITIQEITEKAGLSRRTFYRHFRNSEELFTHVLQEKVVAAYQEVKKYPVVDYFDFIFYFFRYWQTQQPFLEILRKRERLVALTVALEKNRDKSLLVETYPNESLYLYMFAAGGTGNLLVQWILRDFRETPADM